MNYIEAVMKSFTCFRNQLNHSCLLIRKHAQNEEEMVQIRVLPEGLQDRFGVDFEIWLTFGVLYCDWFADNGKSLANI